MHMCTDVRYVFFFSSRRRHTRFDCDWSSDVCSSDLDWRDELPRMDLVIGRGVLPERDRAHRAGDDSKRWEIDSDAREGPRIISPLLVPGDSRDAVERKYRRRSARAQVEICRFGRGRFDLIADLFQDGCDGLGCEDTGSHNISFLYANPSGDVDGI